MKARALSVTRYARAAIVMVLLLGAMLGLVGCTQEPPTLTQRFPRKAIAVVARQLADDAATGDPDYFTGLTPDREAIPALMRRIERSGIATNYADHVLAETSDSAMLGYRLKAEDATATSFSVKLRLIDGSARVEQIVMGKPEQPGDAPATPIPPVGSSEATSSEIGSISVSASIESARLRGYGLHSALVAYTNTSNEATTVLEPLNIELRLIDDDDREVPDELPRDAPASTDASTVSAALGDNL